jgi:hypothetical protein
MLCSDHVRRRVGPHGPDSFALSIPVSIEGCESRLPARKLVSFPPLPQLLVPARAASGAACPYMSSPDCCMPM